MNAVDFPKFKFDIGDIVSHVTDNLLFVIVERAYVFDTVGELGIPYIHYKCVNIEESHTFNEVELTLYKKGVK